MGPRSNTFALLPLLLLAANACSGDHDYTPRDGDVIFQTSLSSQSLAIQRATASPYSHVGVVAVQDDGPWVLEAVEPVKLTPLADWVARGEGRKFVVKRLRDADRLLNAAGLAQLRTEGRRHLGKSYDLYFEWSDDRIYCSELVWKIYDAALDLQLGATQELRDFDLDDPLVAAKLAERWPAGPPLDEDVISPAAVFASDLLVQVHPPTGDHP